MKEEISFMTNYLQHQKKASYKQNKKNQCNCAQYTYSLLSYFQEEYTLQIKNFDKREISYSDKLSQHQWNTNT